MIITIGKKKKNRNKGKTEQVLLSLTAFIQIIELILNQVFLISLKSNFIFKLIFK